MSTPWLDYYYYELCNKCCHEGSVPLVALHVLAVSFLLRRVRRIFKENKCPIGSLSFKMSGLAMMCTCVFRAFFPASFLARLFSCIHVRTESANARQQDKFNARRIADKRNFLQVSKDKYLACIARCFDERVGVGLIIHST
jgi:hypothetical protein